MKNAVILLLILTLLIGCSQEAPTVPESEETDAEPHIQLTPTSEGPFKYFQIDASTGLGVAGVILLNDKQIHDFTEEGSQISSNEAQDLIKSGENEITLKLSSITTETTTAAFSDSVIQIGLHAMNEPGFPEDENKIIGITWDPKPGQTTEEISYVFTMQR
jgi:hypothetical protein